MIGAGISEPFIRRPIGTSLLMVAILLLGIIAFRVLPVSALPRIDFPTVGVSAQLPGADPETMASSVAAPLERRFGQIAGVSELTSVSGLGTTSITLQFALDRDVDLAVRDVQAAITAARSELPANLPNPPTWRKSNPSDAPILILALTSKTLSAGALYQAASTVMTQRISQVPGVGQVINSGSKYAVRVRADPTALSEMGISLDDLRNTISNADARGAKGRMDGSQNAYTIRDNDQLYRARDYRPLIVRTQKGAIVRLNEVAQVTDDVVDRRVAGWFGDDRAVLVIVFKQPNANVIDTVDGIVKLLPELQKWMPPGAEVQIVSDRTQSIRTSVRDVEMTLLLTIGLVIGIVFIFLRRLWSTFAAASTVPLSLLGTFAGMYLCGYNIDNLSLMALTVAVGFVVDDAIVMIENVTRRAEQGDAPLQAALTGARQIAFTVISISVSLVAVFIPLLFMGGLVGRLFHEFAVTLSISIAVSAVVSLTATPMLCAYLAPQSQVHETRPAGGWFGHLSENALNGLVSFYGKTLDIVLRHPWLTFYFTLGTVALTIYMYTAVAKDFFPSQDNGRLMVTTEARVDISFQEMTRLQLAVADELKKIPDINDLGSFIGATNYNAAVNSGRFYMDLKPLGQRRPMREVIAAIRNIERRVPGVNIYPAPIQDLRVGGRISKSLYQYTLSDIDVGELNAFSFKLLDRMKRMPELVAVNTDQLSGGKEVRVLIDRDAATRYGITPADIDNALYNAFGQRQVAVIYTDNDQYRVVLEANAELLEYPASLNAIYVRGRGGKQVPLRELATFKPGPLPLAINHQGQFPSVTISFDLIPKVSIGEATTLIENATKELNPPSGLRASFQGNAQAFQESGSSLFWLVIMSLVTIYIILGVLYESLIHPLTILSTIPSAGIGALLALQLCGLPLDLMGMIGIILLIGIVKKNAIMMIDFAIEAERTENKSPTEAVREACALRFRPIIMTTMAALLGALPLALGTGSGAELRRPLGVAIVGGLLMSQALTLYTTPVVYIMLDRVRMWLVALIYGKGSASKEIEPLQAHT